MERIFEGEVFEIVPQAQGIVFSYRKASAGKNVVVAYKMLSLENDVMTDVAKNIYLLSKFGSNYRSSSELCSNYITARSAVLPSGRVFLCTDNGNAYLIDGDGLPIWSGDFKYKGNVPSDIAIHKNSLWACYSKSGVLLRFNLNTMREELRIGGTNSPFDKPVDIFVDEDNAFISNSGSNKVIKVNLDSYGVREYKEFSESVYAYRKIKDREFVLLESGIYVL